MIAGCSAARVHRIPLRIRDDRERPFWGRDGNRYIADLGQARSPNIFANGAGQENSPSSGKSAGDPQQTCPLDGTAVDDQAALVTRLSISFRSATKSIGLVRSASAPPSRAFFFVLSSP